jgi:hypothetical protein
MPISDLRYVGRRAMPTDKDPLHDLDLAHLLAEADRAAPGPFERLGERAQVWDPQDGLQRVLDQGTS